MLIDRRYVKWSVCCVFFFLRRLQKWLARTRVFFCLIDASLIANRIWILNINLEQENKRAHATRAIHDAISKDRRFLFTSVSEARDGMPKNRNKLRLEETEENRGCWRVFACAKCSSCIHGVFKVAICWKTTCTHCSHCANVRARSLARTHTHTLQNPTADSLSMNEHLVYLLTYSHYDARNDFIIYYFFRLFGLSAACTYVFFFAQAALEVCFTNAFAGRSFRTIHRMHRKMQFWLWNEIVAEGGLTASQKKKNSQISSTQRPQF